MNKQGKILLLETNPTKCEQLCSGLQNLPIVNEIMCFSDPDDASVYLKDHNQEVFLVLQNFSSPGLHLQNTRNMVYMHEKFNIPSIAYMFLIHPLEDKNKTGHTFIHCYYRLIDNVNTNDVFLRIIDFWKDHVFPALTPLSKFRQG